MKRTRTKFFLFGDREKTTYSPDKFWVRVGVREGRVTSVYENCRDGAGYTFLAQKQMDIFTQLQDNVSVVKQLQKYGFDTSALVDYIEESRQ